MRRGVSPHVEPQVPPPLIVNIKSLNQGRRVWLVLDGEHVSTIQRVQWKFPLDTSRVRLGLRLPGT